jgi:predicted TIM-barrel fold metal-dependent hydrolase
MSVTFDALSVIIVFIHMNNIIDFHTHAFPDELAGKAMKHLEGEGDIKAHLDGRVSSLLQSMDKNGIDKSIVCSIATKPSQFEPIIEWSKKIRSDRIIPFPSIHPEDTQALDHLSEIKGEGFTGVKFHPYYQDFSIDEERMFPVYEKVLKDNLMIVMHTGFDFAFERMRIADPVKILKVYDEFPGIKLVTTHLGAWDDWNEVEKHLIGKNIYMEISFSLEFLEKEKAKSLIQSHPKEYIFFGTDSPWTDQGNTLSLLKKLELGHELESQILHNNALKLIEEHTL